MMRVTALLLATTSVCAQDYSAVLKGLWKSSDKDNDGVLNLVEFKSAAAKLDLRPSIFTLHGQSLDNFYAAINTDANAAGLTQKELADSLTKYPSYKQPLQSAFTNGAADTPNPGRMVSNLQSQAGYLARTSKAKVVMKIEVAGSVSDIFPGQRADITSYFASTCGVPVSSVIMTFLPKTTASGRRLQSGGGVEVEGTAFVKDDAAVRAARQKLPKDAAGFQAVPAFSDVTVTSAAVTARPELKLSYTEPGIVGGLLVVVCLLLCVVSQIVAKRKAAKASATGGCCQTGCCSFYAVKPWAFGEFLALLAIVGTVFFLYTRMDSLTKTLIGLLDTIVALARSTSPLVRSITSNLPQSIISTIAQQKSQLTLLPFAVMGPGALCIVLLLLATLCPLLPQHKGSYCWSKCCIMLANLFLLISLIFYIIFAAVALILENAPPPIQNQIAQVTTLCDTMPPTIMQLVADAQAVITLLKTAGQSTSTFDGVINDLSTIIQLVDTGCGHVNQLFVDVYAIFLPGLTCVVAIIFAMFVNNTLCCAEGCCKSPPTGVNSKAGVEMTGGPTQEV